MATKGKEERNQIRVLCADCGSYYFWDVLFNFKNYSSAVNQTPREANKCCPKCGGQDVAEHAHHSGGMFNCEINYNLRPPRYMSGKGSLFEPTQV